MKTIYLSIDMDYWHIGKTALKCLTKLLDALPKSIPIVACMNHQQLLQHVNKHPASLLVNIDTHSDIADEETTKDLNCGTWVSYVKWRHNASYIWLHEKQLWQGNCNNLYPDNQWNYGHGYITTIERQTRHSLDILKALPKEGKVVGVGICLSPDYIETDDLETVFRQIVKRYGIRYLKGRRNENYCRNIRPPNRKRTLMDKQKWDGINKQTDTRIMGKHRLF